ncbi:MAG: carboxypeptidase regulatory-like domain-containing protein [Acidobacteriota bacterium]
MVRYQRLGSLVFLLLLLFTTTALLAQQTGEVAGRVTAVDGSVLPGVTVEARSNALPQSRVTTTDESGYYRLPVLQPGQYTLSFTLAGMQSASRNVEVLLNQTAAVSLALGMEGMAESITVTAEASLVNKETAEVKSALSSEEIASLPVGQDYRDLLKLAPAVQYTQDTVRGPSSGGSGQDNVYQFDGVNVSLPQYGTLSAEPASYDIAQVSVTKGGATAVDFNRAGGFTIDSVSKSGTNKFSGQVSYQVQTAGLTSEQKGTNLIYDQDRGWAQVNIGGPILSDQLFFYGSYYKPTINRENRANNYGELPDYKSDRDEYFGKLTYTPISSILLNGSYRDSKRLDTSSLFAVSQAATSGTGNESKQKIGILEGSWVINNKSYATMKFNDFKLYTGGVPDNIADASISTAIGTHLDLARLDQIGTLTVPVANSANAAVNAFRQPYIDRYGYVGANGARVGGGTVGYGSLFDADDFFRRSWQAGYNMTIGSVISHDLHGGYQRYTDAEDLARSTNGWGTISVGGGATSFQGKPIFFTAALQQQSEGNIPPIHSEIRSESFEINDTMRWNDWSFNVGVLASHDTLYGQGLKEADNIAGYVSSVGSRYKMYDIPFKKMIQPRLGATWAYNSRDTVYASYASYNPAVSSLPRAASWDRNLRQTINAYFDADGTLFALDPVRSSSGKLFMDDMDPRQVAEYLVGTARQLTPGWSARVYGRYRYSDNFWEDTPNDARLGISQTPPPAGVPRTLYMPDLAAKLAAIGSGSTYVIANLDGAFTKYYEATLESDYRFGKAFIKGTYTWSHYYGNFDQDGTTGCGTPPTPGSPCDDQNTFIGSSNIADAAGRQIWDNKYGDLHGDRRHLMKIFGSYSLPWNASAGAFGIYQSGQPWEAWDYHVYQPYSGTSTSDTIRYAEPAGRRRTPAHYQMDVNYIQNLPIVSGFNVQLQLDVFNLLDKQTGYRYQPSKNSPLFNTPGLYYSPRRLQLAARVTF